jgi:hypothetical protein
MRRATKQVFREFKRKPFVTLEKKRTRGRSFNSAKESDSVCGWACAKLSPGCPLVTSLRAFPHVLRIREPELGGR